jgi:L-methionine (R)-S-oxide reductase
MQSALEDIIQRFGADTGAIHLLEDGVLKLKAQVGLPEHIAKIVAVVPVGKGMAGLCAERDEPVSSCNIQIDTSGNVRPAAKQTGVNGAIVVPIRAADGTLRGTLGIGVHRVYEYTDAEIARLLEEGTKLLS